MSLQRWLQLLWAIVVRLTWHIEQRKSSRLHAYHACGFQVSDSAFVLDSQTDITFGCFSILFRFPKAHQVFLYQPFSLEVLVGSKSLVRLLAARFQNTNKCNSPCDVVCSINSATVAIVLGLPGAKGGTRSRATMHLGAKLFRSMAGYPLQVLQRRHHTKGTKGISCSTQVCSNRCSGAIVVSGNTVTFWKPKPGPVSIFNIVGQRVSFRIC